MTQTNRDSKTCRDILRTVVAPPRFPRRDAPSPAGAPAGAAPAWPDAAGLHSRAAAAIRAAALAADDDASSADGSFRSMQSATTSWVNALGDDR